MKLIARSGVTLATAAALLVVGMAAPIAPASAAYMVKCFGVNACKGHGSCKSLANACKGQNACKGRGFVLLGKSSCVAKGGTLTHG